MWQSFNYLYTQTMDTSQHDSAQLQELVNAGDPQAQYQLATLYRKGGGGVSRDLEKAAATVRTGR